MHLGDPVDGGEAVSGNVLACHSSAAAAVAAYQPGRGSLGGVSGW